MVRVIFLYSPFIFLILSCSSTSVKDASMKTESLVKSLQINNSVSNQYWYQGKAEVNSYQLIQARYGQLHKGDAVLIFVFEDQSKKSQIKLDDPISAGIDRQPSFKMNMMKRFNTGIYTYNLMLSVFNPIGFEVSSFVSKTTVTVQDWCGHVFSQLNNRDNKFVCKNFSYFESDGDTEQVINAGWSEDGLWNQIRINPNLLPIGEVQLLPEMFYNRLKHRPQIYMNAKLQVSSINDSIQEYSIQYPTEFRTLKIRFTKENPYKIISWIEVYKDGSEMLTTSAELLHSEMTDYWTKHNVQDTIWRKVMMLK